MVGEGNGIQAKLSSERGDSFVVFLFECWRKVKGRLLFFFFRFYSSKQREEAILEQENIQDHMKLHKKKENVFFYF